MRYLSRRLIHATFLLIAISVLSFALIQLTPGDFFSSMRMNPRISAQTIERIRSQYGLDRSLPVRYERWMRSVLRGQMGFSLAYNSPVAPLLLARARNTLLLSSVATLLAWILALPLGIWSAANRGKWIDRVCGLATTALLTIPDLVVFLFLLLIAARTGWLPAGGMVSPTMESSGLWGKSKDVALHLLLPSLSLAIVLLPALVRHIRSAMVEVLKAPFIRAARGHGIARLRLLLRYALPAAANPLISLFGFCVGTILSASLLVEVILSWPGLGPLLMEAIQTRDLFVVVGVVLVSSVFLVAGNLFADILLFAADPRIRGD
jgi:peptide/nickel transport system permease protein